jgi:hypothetical protein
MIANYEQIIVYANSFEEFNHICADKSIFKYSHLLFLYLKLFLFAACRVITNRSIFSYYTIAFIRYNTGTGMTNGPDGLGMRAFHTTVTGPYFSKNEYITTDYNKNADLRKVLVVYH